MKKKTAKHAKEAFMDIQDIFLICTSYPSLKLIIHGNKFIRLIDGRMKMCENYTRIENPRNIENATLRLFKRLSLASSLMNNEDFLQLVLFTGANSNEKDINLSIKIMPGSYTETHPEYMDKFLRKFI